MARSDEAEWWFNAVYEAVQEIPYGKVTSYGHIARLLGRRRSRNPIHLAFYTNGTFYEKHNARGENVDFPVHSI